MTDDMLAYVLRSWSRWTRRLMAIFRQAYETRSDFARQRSTLSGIQTRMTGVLSEYPSFSLGNVSHTVHRYYSRDQQPSVDDQNSKKKGFHHHRLYHWIMPSPSYHLHVLACSIVMQRTTVLGYPSLPLNAVLSLSLT